MLRCSSSVGGEEVNITERYGGNRKSRRTRKHLFRLAALTFAAASVVLVSYLVYSGRADSWPRADCTVIGSRVIRYDAADSWRDIAMYRGQFKIRYEVDGREYYTWADAGWLDKDKDFVEQRVAALPKHCDFTVRYDPKNPRESVAVPH